MISADDANLERFGRHVPRVLGNQIIAQLVDQYLSDMNAPSIEPEFERSCPPSIERFHAALLFVDISGFTILSQRLPVDALRLHINAYFKKILDIIFKYGGDVIKFAGDALFITWQTPVSDLAAPNFEEAARISVQRAVSCGQQINVECSNYMIDLAPKKQTTSQLTSALLEGKLQTPQHLQTSGSRPSNVAGNIAGDVTPSGHGTISPSQYPGSPPPEPVEQSTEGVPSPTGAAAAAPAHGVETSTITYLNVHSGVGVGVMAGIDVGANNRWEYLLLGQPLSDVAVAESMASKGELVISPAAHALLCGVPATGVPTPGKSASRKAAIPTISETESASSHDLGQQQQLQTSNAPAPICKCMRCVENSEFWRVSPDIPLVPAVNTETPEELAEYDLYFYSEIMERTTVAYREIMHQIDEMVYNKFKANVGGTGHSISLTSLPTFSLLSPRSGPSTGASSVASSVRTAPSSVRSQHDAQVVSERMGHAHSAQHSHCADLGQISEVASIDMTLSASTASEFGQGGLQHLRSSPGLSELAQSRAIGTISEESVCMLPSTDAYQILAADATAKTAMMTMCSAEVTEVLFGHYLSWVQHCLLDDFAMHVHEADRTDFEFRSASRKGALERFASSHFGGISAQFSSVSQHPVTLTSQTTSLSTSSSAANINSAVSSSSLSNSAINTPPRRASNFRGSLSGASSREPSAFVHKMRTLNSTHMTLKEQNKNKNRRIRNQDTSLTAELRNVIVLFISLKLESAQLLTSEGDTSSSGKNSVRFSEKLSEKATAQCYARHGDQVMSRIKGFHFLTRTEEEFNDDQRIMNSFQDCMEVMTKIFKDNGGQMRQFIVDDKGTVCIGTFGLRGSVTNDNAAAAIDAAGAIIMQLHKIGIEASIGITSGKAYCGLVGSPLRHEYAVMGPSTNLSARLMGKAKQGEVMCDGETRNRDRTHTFTKLGEIQAKGYANPVPTFKPSLSKHQKVRLGSSNINLGINRMETLSGKGTTFFDPAQMASPSFRAQHSLYDLHSSSGSNSNLVTPHSKGGRNNFRFRSHRKTPQGDSNQRLPLEGRNEEANDVFAFLCPAFVKQYGDLCSFAQTTIKFSFANNAMTTSAVTSSAQASSGMRKLRFDTTQRTKACIIQGPGGIGKSSFLKIFCDKIRNIHKSDPTINMFIFHSQTNGNNAQPFNVWKGIVRQVLLHFAQLADPPAQHVHGRSTLALSVNVDVSTKEGAQSAVKQELAKGLDYAMTLLPEDLQDCKALMSSIHFVYGIKENESATKLSGVAKLLKVTELLSALLQQFTASTEKLLVIAIDDLHDMDSASWQLLKHLWEHNTGVVIAATHTANVATKKGVDLNLFRDLDRIYLMNLKPLGLGATKLIASAIFESNGVDKVEDAVYDKLYTMSGGNALFLYELSKAMLEWYHNSVQDEGTAAEGTEPESQVAAQSKPHISFSAAIQDFRTTRIEEVICYRFDQFDTAAQLLLKLASVACANNEVFSLPLLSFMIKEDSVTMSAFACLHSPSTAEGEDEVEASGGVSRDGDGQAEEEDTIGFERENSEHFEMVDSGSVLVATLNSLLSNNEFIKIVNKRQESMTGSIRAIQSLHLAANSTSSLLDGMEEGEDEDTVGDLSPLISPSKLTGLNPVTKLAALKNNAASLAKMHFDFKIRLEQSTIYDLMLNDQKQSLHERVAAYLEMQSSERVRNGVQLTSTELFEEGFHWERATGWSSAMSCYYRSAMLLDEVGAFQDSFLHLTAAYRMLNAMRNEAGVTEDFQFAPASFQAIFSHGKDGEKETTHALKKSDIVRIFGGDSTLLELGLNVLLRLAQSSFTLSDTPEVTSKLYEDALQLIMLTWNWKDALALNHDLGVNLGIAASIDDLESDAAVPPIVSPGKLSRSRTHNTDISELGNFGLRDPTIVFPILAGIAALYRNNKLQDDKQRTKESTLYDLSLVLARTSPDYLPHLICAMCLQRTLIFELGKIKESLTMAGGIVSMYNEQEHGPQLIKAYGNNRVPYTIMMHVQLLRTVGYLTKSAVMLNAILDELPHMTHLHSVGITVYPIVSVMLLEGSQRVALQVFRSYLALEKERGGYNFFKESNPLFLEALEVALTYETFTNKKDLSKYIAHCETAASQLIENKVLNKEFLPADKSSRSMLYETLTSFGTSVEHCCGMLLLLKARMTSKRIEMRREERQALVWKYLHTALEYENFHITCCMDSEPGSSQPVNIDKLAFAHFGSLVTKACICATMVHYEAEIASSALPVPVANKAPEVTINKQELLREATVALQAVEQIGVSKGYHFVTLHAGVYLEILGLDTRRGKQLQAQALDAMQELNGAKEFASAFDAIISAFPILERFKIKYTLLDETKTK